MDTIFFICVLMVIVSKLHWLWSEKFNAILFSYLDKESFKEYVINEIFFGSINIFFCLGLIMVVERMFGFTSALPPNIFLKFIIPISLVSLFLIKIWLVKNFKIYSAYGELKTKIEDVNKNISLVKTYNEVTKPWIKQVNEANKILNQLTNVMKTLNVLYVGFTFSLLVLFVSIF